MEPVTTSVDANAWITMSHREWFVLWLCRCEAIPALQIAETLKSGGFGDVIGPKLYQFLDRMVAKEFLIRTKSRFSNESLFLATTKGTVAFNDVRNFYLTWNEEPDWAALASEV